MCSTDARSGMPPPPLFPGLWDTVLLLLFSQAAKFSGSGGAAIVLPRDPSQVDQLKAEMNTLGIVFVKIIPNLEHSS